MKPTATPTFHDRHSPTSSFDFNFLLLLGNELICYSSRLSEQCLAQGTHLTDFYTLVEALTWLFVSRRTVSSNLCKTTHFDPCMVSRSKLKVHSLLTYHDHTVVIQLDLSGDKCPDLETMIIDFLFSCTCFVRLTVLFTLVSHRQCSLFNCYTQINALCRPSHRLEN